MLTRFEPPSHGLPFEFGTPDQFRRLREMLERLGYRQADVYARLEALEQAEARGEPVEQHRTRDRLGVLLTLFRGLPIPRKLLATYLDQTDIELLETFRLILPVPQDPTQVRATVLLYPVAGLYLISDLDHLPGGPNEPPPDVVYPAITSNTEQFLELLPREPCERFLELCAGTGIAALAASRYATHAWAVDITDRATRFAQFNVLMNGIENVTALQGDLYEPVKGRTFDRIVAHPPYVPSPQQEFIFRDGGEDGEAITRRIIAGLPEYLEPGGRFYCTCLASDRHEAPLEQRVRTTLGEAEGDFDVAVLTRTVFHPSEYYAGAVVSRRMSLDEASAREAALLGLGIEQLVYGSIIVQRRGEQRSVFTSRQQIGPDTDVRAIEWLLECNRLMSMSFEQTEWLEAKPIASPRIELRVVHRSHEGRWQADACSVAAQYPFIAEADCSIWVPQFIARCDGTVTVREHLRMLKESGAVRAQADESAFAGFVRRFIAQGFLEIATCRVPATSSTAMM